VHTRGLAPHRELPLGSVMPDSPGETDTKVLFLHSRVKQHLASAGRRVPFGASPDTAG